MLEFRFPCRARAFNAGVAGALFLWPLVFASSASAQNITFEKTASPTTYTAVGQVIDYTYVMSNSGSFSAFLQSISDDKVASIDCPSPVIPPSGTLTCTGS